MPSWNDVFNEIRGIAGTNAADIVRRKYLRELSDFTGRNTILYYSGWLQSDKKSPLLSIQDEDKNGFMNAVYKMDRKKGLDLLLHTPGGDIAATESLVKYLRSLFGIDIRAIVPMIAMSAGTMIACACKQIIMGKQSSLGPIDPQANGISMPAVIEEFDFALEEIKRDQAKILLWKEIIGKYHPTFLDFCHRATKMSKEMVQEWLETGMFCRNKKAKEIAKNIVDNLSDHKLHKMHSRHIHIEQCKQIGLKVMYLEKDQEFQDKVLSLHHACMYSMQMHSVIKLIEGSSGQTIVIK